MKSWLRSNGEQGNNQVTDYTFYFDDLQPPTVLFNDGKLHIGIFGEWERIEFEARMLKMIHRTPWWKRILVLAQELLSRKS